VLFAASAPAWAHVTVHSDDATRGAIDVAVTFRTPNEQDKASTVKLEVFFPPATPLLGVLVQPHPGWTAVATNAKLATPVKTDDGTITEAVSKVTWTADSTADGLHPGQSGDFVVTAGQLPDAPSLTFKALQTYSNGNVVRWIEVAAPGAPAPDHPAPVLDLAPAASASPSASPSAAATSTPTPTASAQPVATTSTSSSDGLGRGLAIAALAAAVLALLAALRPRRR
jgi:MYXO-CTERM domain-containing protein